MLDNADKEGRKRILSRIEVLGPNEICSESYLLVKICQDEKEAKNVVAYLKTRFVRFLLSTILLTQNIAKDKFAYIPVWILQATMILIGVNLPWK